MSDRNLRKVDRLSELPEPLLLHILSFLPTKFAVRTSVLARRYRRLWTASPSFELDRSEFPPGRLFNDVTSRCLRLRDPSAPLVRFCLRSNSYRPIPIKFISNWLNRAHSLGMRDLSLHIHTETIESLFPLILSFGSLHSLVINCADSGRILSFRPLALPTFPLIHLKYLCIGARMYGFDLKAFIMEQRNLEYLWIESPAHDYVDLSSQSVKILKFKFSYFTGSKIYLSFPKLEFLDLSISLGLKQFRGEMPVLRKALVKTSSLPEEHVPILYDLLKSITNVSELILYIGKPYPKHIPSATRFLRKLEGPSDYQRYRWAPEVWHSKLPQNSNDNRMHAHFSNLQTGDKKSEVIKLLSGEMLSKRLKT